MVEAANLKENPQQKQKISTMQFELQNAQEFRTLQSVLRRHSSTARAIPLSKSKKDDVLSFYYQLQQVSKLSKYQEACVSKLHMLLFPFEFNRREPI